MLTRTALKTITAMMTMTPSGSKYVIGPQQQVNQGQPNVATWAAQLRGRQLESLRLAPHLMHPMATGGLAPTTIKGHRKALSTLAADLPLDQRNAPLANALLEFINRTRRRKKWRWTSTVTKMSTLQGALALLPVYATITLDDNTTSSDPIMLKHCPVWTMAMRAAARKAREQLGVQPKAATGAHIRQVLRSSLSVEMKACILLTWVTGSRCGDVLKLRLADFKMRPDGTLIITFIKGKTVAKRGPYSVSSCLPSTAEAAPIKQHLLHVTGRQDAPLFPNITGKKIKDALRASTGDGKLEQRSLRRGALQELAAQGMPLTTLLLFSGHTTIAMLLRYLGHGTKAVAQNTAMIDAAKLAFG